MCCTLVINNMRPDNLDHFFQLLVWICNIIGGFVGAIVISGLGAILILATLQTFLRDIIMWLMSPKLGTIQLSNVNLIVIFMGAYLSLYLLIKINYNKQRKD